MTNSPSSSLRSNQPSSIGPSSGRSSEERSNPFEDESTNPFDGYSEAGRSSAFAPASVVDDDEEEILEEMTPINFKNIRLNRGSLIQGLAPPATDEESPPPIHEDDLESKADDNRSFSSQSHSTTRASRTRSSRSDPPTPPDSDYASNAPSSIWETSFRTGRTSSIPLQAASPDDNIRRSSNVTNFTKPGKSWCMIILAVVSVLLVGAVIAVSVVVFGNGSERAAQEQDLNNIIYSVSDSAALEDERTPQYKARMWLVYEDTFLKSHKLTDAEQRVIQRYVLAVFYFSTNGPNSWGSNSWLVGGECAEPVWFGISCNDNGEVRAIGFGKTDACLYCLAVSVNL